MNISKHPLDFDALQKGDTLSIDLLRQIFKCGPESTHYGMCVLELRRQIEHARQDLVTRSEKYEIHILSDSENGGYAASICDRAMKRLRRAVEVATKPITQDLDDRQLRERETNTVIVSQVRLGAQQAKRDAMRSFAAQKAKVLP